MLNWLFGNNKLGKLEEETKKGFSAVKDDMDAVGKWIKHLDKKDKQLFESLTLLKEDLSSIREEISSLKHAIDLVNEDMENKQVFKKLPVVGKQTAVQGVEKAVQTPVQTDDFFDIFKSFSQNEKLIIFTLMNSDLKLSYEDLALLLGKERSTVRGQINSIKQKSENIIEEIVEKNGKKRIYIPDKIKDKLEKYSKVRVKRGKKGRK